MKRRSAALEMTLLAVLVLALLLAGFTWLSITWQRQWLLQEVERGLSLAAETLQSSLQISMMHDQRHDLQKTLERVTQHTGVEQIQILNHDGRVAHSSRHPPMTKQVGIDAPACSVCHSGHAGATPATTLLPKVRTKMSGASMFAFSPVLARPDCRTADCHLGASELFGVIELSVPLADSDDAIRRQLYALAGLSGVTVALGGVLLWLALSRWLRRPMRDLMRGIRRVAKGELTYQIPARARDEFGELAASFNAMSRQLASAQEKLIQSERLISMGKLAAGVAHEINNPLTGILSYAEDLMDEIEPSDPRHRDCRVIVQEALRCRAILRNLLDFARQDAPAVKRSRPTDLMERALDVVVRQAVFRNIHFLRRYDAEPPTIDVDPVQIQQVLVNLVVNAQQAMPQGGTITVGVEARDQRTLELSVTDEGPGIPSDVKARVFEPFFSTKGGKTDGLGLAVSLGIIELHGGEIELETEPGRGTVFRILLPVAGVDETKRGDSHGQE